MGLLIQEGLELKPKAISNALMVNVKTKEEANVALELRSSIRREIHRLREDRRVRVIQDALDGFDRIRRTFRNKETLVRHKNLLIDVFGQQGLKRISSNMILYLNKGFNFNRSEFVSVHADGKVSKTLEGWRQIFEIVCVLEREGMRVTFTYAFALLISYKEEDYLELFTALQHHGLPTPPILVTDFELAVVSAAQKV